MASVPKEKADTKTGRPQKQLSHSVMGKQAPSSVRQMCVEDLLDVQYCQPLKGHCLLCKSTSCSRRGGMAAAL